MAAIDADICKGVSRGTRMGFRAVCESVSDRLSSFQQSSSTQLRSSSELFTRPAWRPVSTQTVGAKATTDYYQDPDWY